MPRAHEAPQPHPEVRQVVQAAADLDDDHDSALSKHSIATANTAAAVDPAAPQRSALDPNGP